MVEEIVGHVRLRKRNVSLFSDDGLSSEGESLVLANNTFLELPFSGCAFREDSPKDIRLLDYKILNLILYAHLNMVELSTKARKWIPSGL